VRHKIVTSAPRLQSRLLCITGRLHDDDDDDDDVVAESAEACSI